MHLFTVFPLVVVAGAMTLKFPEPQVPIGIEKSYAVRTPPLDTDWTYDVGTDPWPQYPRPKLARSQWQSLNGLWTYQNASGRHELIDPPFNQTLSHKVLVPFCLESGLSGVQGENTIHSWYRTIFTVPKHWTGDRVLLNFGAVDYEATVFVNGHYATFHRGGYFAFSVDVTDFLKKGDNELVVFAFDPTDSDEYNIPAGKQTLTPSHIFYRSCSGIWQSVWIESAPTNHITDLTIDGDAGGQVTLMVSAGRKSEIVEITVYERGSNHTVGTQTGTVGLPITFKVDSPKTWSPDSPNLYDVKIKMGEDEVSSYTGFRTVRREEVNGVLRVVLNDEPIFIFGTLDQGYWPDGLYTAPTYEAMVFDIKTLKSLGMNMLRKHVKVEPALYYAAADELGILIMQDMPCFRPGHPPDQAEQIEFQRQLGLLVKQFRSYSSIFSWVLYNEGWGQHNSYSSEWAVTDIVRALDPTRLVNTVSGWFDHGAGDFSDDHHYTGPECGVPWGHFDPTRIAIQGEFGGTGHNVSEQHLWKVERAVREIDQTYELLKDLDAWNLRGRYLLAELHSQVELYSCAGGVWTQTTDIEGEVNGLLTYDRRILRPQVKRWRESIQALYDASARRSEGYIAKK